MSHDAKNTVLKKEIEERENPEPAKIIPWPDVFWKPEKKKRIRLDQKFLYYKGKKIPILQFQKAGYERLLKLLVKEMTR